MNQQGKTNVVLIGMPGAGKSTLGVVLAKIMNKGFVDTDLLIQARCGATLQDVIDREGTAAFVALENEVLCSVAEENCIVATGGSAVYSHEAMLHLADIGTVVYLEISFDSLTERLIDLDERGVVLGNATNRPATASKESVLRALYDERTPLYQRYADLTVNIDGLSITAAARKVAALLK